MPRLKSVAISGYKSILRAEIALSPVTLLVGANSAGKSNFISFFRLLNFQMSDGLQMFVGLSGGADALLHYGGRTSPVMEATLDFENQDGDNRYDIRLAHAAGDTLIFAEERLTFLRRGHTGEPFVWSQAGHRETLITRIARTGETNRSITKTARVFRSLLQSCQVYQFHDTSAQARIRLKGDIDDNKHLRADGRNLAAYLRRIRTTHPICYDRMRAAVGELVPHFDDFILEPDGINPALIQLRWRERESGFEFGPHHWSDGSLRIVALLALLMQPEKESPAVILLDEPELGLHPAAIAYLASLIGSISQRTQIIAATQSPALVDQFEPEDVVVVDRAQRHSTFRRLDSAELAEWLTDFRLGDIWQKGVIGGRP